MKTLGLILITFLVLILIPLVFELAMSSWEFYKELIPKGPQGQQVLKGVAFGIPLFIICLTHR